MADYFLVHDPAILDGQLRPALALAWRKRSFAPCLPLSPDWVAAARQYAHLYPINLDETVLAGLPELDEADQSEELELAREWFGALVDLHVATARAGHSLVVEQIY